MAEYILTVAGVERDVQLGSLSLRRPTSGIHTLVCDIESRDGSYRPSLDEDVLLYEDDGTTPTPVAFGGLIMRLRERAQIGTGPSIVTEVQCSDYSLLAHRTVLVDVTLAAGTLKSQLTTLVNDHLSTQGITLHASQVDGPTLESTSYDGQPSTEALNAIALAAEMVWIIDHNKVLRVIAPGTESAPDNITESNRSDLSIVGDIIVERSRSEGYATRIIVRFGTGTALQTEAFDGDGVTTSWATDLPADPSFEINVITRIIDIVSSSVADPTVITTAQAHGLRTGDRVRIAGHAGSTPSLNGSTDRRVTVLSPTTFTINVNVTTGGTGGTVRDTVPLWTYEPELGEDSPFPFQWDAITHTIYQRTGDTPIPSGTQLELTYNAQYPGTEIVTGSPPGTIDKVIEAPEAFTRDAARAIGEAELARSSSDLIRVEYRTHDGVGYAPGQVMSIVESYRNLNHSCLITEIASRDISVNLLEHTVQLIANDQYLPGWRKVYQDWLGGMGGGAGGGTATTVTSFPPLPIPSGQVLVAMLEITHEEILAGEPITLVRSPGDGFALVPVYFQTSRDFLSVYTSGSPGTDTDLNPRLCYEDETKPVSNSDGSPGPSETIGFSLRYIPDEDFTVPQVDNQPLVVAWTPVDGGGSSSNVLRVSCAYYIVPVADSDAPHLLVSVTAGAAAGADSVTSSAIDTTGANFLAVAITHFGGTTITVTDNKGNTYTGLTKATTADAKEQIWYCANPNVGSGHTFTLTIVEDSAFPALIAAAFSNVTLTSPFDVLDNSTDSSGTSVVAGPITPAEHVSLILTALGHGGTTILGVDGDFNEIDTLQKSTGDHMGLSFAYQVQETAAAISATWTTSAPNDSLAATIAAFKPEV